MEARRLCVKRYRVSFRPAMTARSFWSGCTKGPERLPAFDRMLKAAVHRKFDMIAAWSVDRLGRSLQELVGFLGELKAATVDLFLHQQSLDTSTPSGPALLQMLGVFAEFEAAMIRERTRAGLFERAQGKRLGRPPRSE